MSIINDAKGIEILTVDTHTIVPRKTNINSKTIYATFRRFMDIVLSAMGLLVLSPILILTSIAIKLDSKGPIIFKQKRVGKDGKIFDIYKFRSMAENNNASDLSVPDKYIGIGKFIRKTSIDELPQLINVIKGDMTFIGPRPWTPIYYENMTEEQKHRHDVLPGITGLAQVNGRNCANVIDRINYDLEYINNYNLKTDIKIIFKTFTVIFCKENADGGKGTVKNDLNNLRNYQLQQDYSDENDEDKIIKKKILIVAPKTSNLINFRGDLMKDIIKKGYDIVALVPEKESEDFFENNGIKLRVIELDKNSFSLLKTYSYYRKLIKIMKEEKPDKVFSYTIKPVVFGSLAASKAKVKEIYSLVCGLGYLFSVNTLKVKLIRTFCGIGYKWALSKNNKVIFQNQDDIDEFARRGYVKKDKCELVNGSGVNLERFTKNDIPNDKVSFIMVCRVLREKGVLEYFEAAKIVKEKYPNVKFVYIGAIDKNVNAISLDTLKPYIDNNIVEYISETKTVEKYLAESSVFVLPSYYREGIPRSIIEATAMGRPIITTDTPGCRETVRVGENGLFAKTKDVDDLADKMSWMIEHKDRLQEMGNKSYELCLSKFKIDIINDDMMKIMNIKGADSKVLIKKETK